MPEHLAPYFDMNAWARDLAYDYTTTAHPAAASSSSARSDRSPRTAAPGSGYLPGASRNPTASLAAATRGPTMTALAALATVLIVYTYPPLTPFGIVDDGEPLSCGDDVSRSSELSGSGLEPKSEELGLGSEWPQ